MNQTFSGELRNFILPWNYLCICMGNQDRFILKSAFFYSFFKINIWSICIEYFFCPLFFFFWIQRPLCLFKIRSIFMLKHLSTEHVSPKGWLFNYISPLLTLLHPTRLHCATIMFAHTQEYVHLRRFSTVPFWLLTRRRNGRNLKVHCKCILLDFTRQPHVHAG